MLTACSIARTIKFSFAVIFLLISQAACSLSAAPVATPTLEPTSMPASTATIAPSATPLPTATTAPTATLTPTPDHIATQNAKATANMQSKMEVVGPVMAQLGIPTDTGELIWYEEGPITLMVETYNSFNPEQIVENHVGDFVFHSEVTWDSSSGLAGCGLQFRSDGNFDTGKYYEFDLLRLQNAPAWYMYYARYGYIEKEMTGYKFDSGINDAKDSQNTIDFVAQGNQFFPYINGEKKLTVESSELKDGLVYILAHQEFGKTYCKFQNSWLWSLD